MSNSESKQPKPVSSNPDDLYRYLNASSTLESTRSQIEALEQTAAVEDFHLQMELLRRRLQQRVHGRGADDSGGQGAACMRG